MKEKGAVIFLPELEMSLDSLRLHLSNLYNLKIEKMEHKMQTGGTADSAMSNDPMIGGTAESSMKKGGRIQQGDYVKTKPQYGNISGEVTFATDNMIVIKNAMGKTYMFHPQDLVHQMAKGGKLNIGDTVHITDNKSMFKGKSGVILSQLTASTFIVKILVDGEERNVVVRKSGVEYIENLEEGGLMSSDDLYSYDTQQPKDDDEDLFENWEKLPDSIMKILDKYSDAEGYTDLEAMLKAMEKEGYTFEYGLDATPYGLKKMATGGGVGKEKGFYVNSFDNEIIPYSGDEEDAFYYPNQLSHIFESFEDEGVRYLLYSGKRDVIGQINNVIKDLQNSKRPDDIQAIKTSKELIEWIKENAFAKESKKEDYTNKIKYYKQLIKDDESRLKKSSGAESEHIMENLSYNKKALRQLQSISNKKMATGGGVPVDSFIHEGRKYTIKKVDVDSDTIFTWEGKMFGFNTLKNLGVKFTYKKDLPKKPRNPRGVRGKRREIMEDELFEMKRDLKDLYAEKRQIFIDQEVEAGQMGLEEFEKSGLSDEYGQRLNQVNIDIEAIKSKISEYETKLSYAKGGATPSQKRKIGKVMHEWKHGKLHSGSKKGPIVKEQKQAVAIALSEAGLSKPKKMTGWKHKRKKI